MTAMTAISILGRFRWFLRCRRFLAWLSAGSPLRLGWMPGLRLPVSGKLQSWFGLLALAAQRWLVRRLLRFFLLLAGGVLRRSPGLQGCQRGNAVLYVNFFFRLDDDLPSHLGDLDHCDLIAHQPDEHHVLRQFPVDPIFVFIALVVLFADLLFRAVLGHNHHVAIHSNQDLMILYGVANLRRKRLGVHLDSAFLGEINHRADQLLEFFQRHLRNRFGELQGTSSAGRPVFLTVDGGNASPAAAYAYADVLVPLGLLLRSA